MKGRLCRAAGLLAAILLAAVLVVPAAAELPAVQHTATVRVPATGSATSSGGGAVIDYSNSSEGYVMVRYSGTASRVKLQVAKSGGTTYTYNLNTSGNYETFPFTSGSGSYTISVFENVYGNQYAKIAGASVNVSLSNELLPYLYPNQYVNFNADSATVKKGDELAAGVSDQVTIVSNVYNYVIKNISYDTALANQISTGQITTYLPKVDSVLANGKGICFDYAAVMAAMLRSQNIPTRLQVGYVSGGVYHAWISVWTSATGWINNAIYFDGVNWKLMDPTFASSANQSSSIMDFIGNGSNYSVSYTY